MLGVGFDFLAELVDEDAEVFGLVAVVRTPDSLQQAAVGLGFSSVGDELPKQLEFLGRQLYGSAFYGDRAFFEIDHQIVGNEGRDGVAGAGATQGSADAGHQFLDAEGLDDVIIGAGVERLDLVAFGVAHGEHDDGNVAGGPNFAASIEAGDAGQIHVENDQVGVLGTDKTERLFSRFGFDDGITVRGKSGAHHPADLGLVVDDENGLVRHQSPERTLRSMGTVKENTDPWPRWLVRVMVPPWASMMERQIESPSPSPPPFVV